MRVGQDSQHSPPTLPPTTTVIAHGCQLPLCRREGSRIPDRRGGKSATRPPPSLQKKLYVTQHVIVLMTTQPLSSSSHENTLRKPSTPLRSTDQLDHVTWELLRSTNSQLNRNLRGGSPGSCAVTALRAVKGLALQHWLTLPPLPPPAHNTHGRVGAPGFPWLHRGRSTLASPPNVPQSLSFESSVLLGLTLLVTL